MMRVKYRSTIDTVAQILEITNGGATRSQIFYRSFVSHHHLKRFLPALIYNHLLDYDPTTHIYKTTEKGITYLNAYREISECVAGSDLEIGCV